MLNVRVCVSFRSFSSCSFIDSRVFNDFSGFWIFSNTLNAVRPFSLSALSPRGFFQPKETQFDDKEREILVESLLKRVEKLEAAETSKMVRIFMFFLE